MYGDGGLPLTSWLVQYKAAVYLYRPAKVYRCGGDSLFMDVEVDLFEQGIERHVDGTVDDYAHGAIVIVFADKGNGLCKIRIGHRGHRDQEVAGEIYVFHESYYRINIIKLLLNNR